MSTLKTESTENSVQGAVFDVYEAVVWLLPEKEADVNHHGEQYVNSLQATSFRGHETVGPIATGKRSGY